MATVRFRYTCLTLAAAALIIFSLPCCHCSSIGDFVSDVTRPTNLVLAFDQSAGVDRATFYLQSKRLAAQLLRYYVIVGPYNVRVAALTFGQGRDVTVAFDYVTEPITKCELMDINGSSDNTFPWSKLYYEVVSPNTGNTTSSTASGSGLSEAFDVANDIFTLASKDAERVKAMSVVVLFASGRFDLTKAANVSFAKLKKKSGAKIYVVGVDSDVSSHTLDVIASPGCYAPYNAWRNLTHVTLAYHDPDKDYVWRPLPSSHLCSSCPSGASCYCDVMRGVASCLCDKQRYYDNRTGQCLACTPGTYKERIGNSQPCRPCESRDGQAEDDVISGDEDEEDYESGEDDCQAAAFCNTTLCESTDAHCDVVRTGSHVACPCLPGWTTASGETGNTTCDVNIDDCAPGAGARCASHALCVDGLDGYACRCPPGFVGRYCDVDESECDLDLCQNGAQCHDFAGTYMCVCTEDFTGPFCESSLHAIGRNDTWLRYKQEDYSTTVSALKDDWLLTDDVRTTTLGPISDIGRFTVDQNQERLATTGMNDEVSSFNNNNISYSPLTTPLPVVNDEDFIVDLKAESGKDFSTVNTIKLSGDNSDSDATQATSFNDVTTMFTNNDAANIFNRSAQNAAGVNEIDADMYVSSAGGVDGGAVLGEADDNGITNDIMFRGLMSACFAALGLIVLILLVAYVAYLIRGTRRRRRYNTTVRRQSTRGVEPAGEEGGASVVNQPPSSQSPLTDDIAIDREQRTALLASSPREDGNVAMETGVVASLGLTNTAAELTGVSVEDVADWNTYLDQLRMTGAVDRACIVSQHSSSKRASTVNWAYSHAEILHLLVIEQRLLLAEDAAMAAASQTPPNHHHRQHPHQQQHHPSMSSRADSFDDYDSLPAAEATGVVQGTAYVFHMTTDGSIMGQPMAGRETGHMTTEEPMGGGGETLGDLWLCHTKKYIVVGIAPGQGQREADRCRDEITWTAQHIIAQGY